MCGQTECASRALLDEVFQHVQEFRSGDRFVVADTVGCVAFHFSLAWNFAMASERCLSYPRRPMDARSLFWALQDQSRNTQ